MLWLLTATLAWSSQVRITGPYSDEIANSAVIAEGVIAAQREEPPAHWACANIGLQVSTVRITRLLKGDPALTRVDVTVPVVSTMPIVARVFGTCPTPVSPTLEVDDHVLVMLVPGSGADRYWIASSEMVFWERDSETFGTLTERPIVKLPGASDGAPSAPLPTSPFVSLGQASDPGVPWQAFVDAIELLVAAQQ